MTTTSRTIARHARVMGTIASIHVHHAVDASDVERVIDSVFDELRRRMPTLHIVGEPDYLQSNFINGVKRMRCAW